MNLRNLFRPGAAAEVDPDAVEPLTSAGSAREGGSADEVDSDEDGGGVLMLINYDPTWGDVPLGPGGELRRLRHRSCDRSTGVRG